MIQEVTYMKKCPGCEMVVANVATICPNCKHKFTSSEVVRSSFPSGDLGKLNNTPQKVCISAVGELCWVPLYERKYKYNTPIFNNTVDLQKKQPTGQRPQFGDSPAAQLGNSPAARLARERAEAAKAQIEMRKAAEAAKAQLERSKQNSDNRDNSVREIPEGLSTTNIGGIKVSPEDGAKIIKCLLDHPDDGRVEALYYLKPYGVGLNECKKAIETCMADIAAAVARKKGC